jgi:protein-S-isoprenylcysteine O-methyltransferase Ste14
VTVDVLVPGMLVRASGARFDPDAADFVGLLLVLGGCLLLLDCVFLRFALEGRGTLAPIDPPRFVVRGGPYRVVRNPMYVANVVVITGIGLLVGSWRVLAWAGLVLVAFHLFVVAYEEPTLRRLFGDAYDAYSREVGRWIPRRRKRTARRRSDGETRRPSGS